MTVRTQRSVIDRIAKSHTPRVKN